jgi:ABC-type phosphate transport system substrate-binding protein
MRAKRRSLRLLATGVAGALALSGAVGAGSAMAEKPTEPCKGLNIKGQGSSLQKIAQQNLWIPAFTTKCSGSGGAKVEEYNPSGSGAGRTVFGAEKPGNKPSGGKGESPNESGDTFIGTDEPLTPQQMERIDEAAGAPEESGKFKGQTLVIPVAQAAVAMIVNPPAECTITEITNANLLAVWNGTKTKWSEIATGCPAKSITRVTRKDVSGTTYVMKTYLEEIAKGTATCDGKKWSELAKPENNLEWPISTQSGCSTVGALVHAKNQGGGGEAEEVLKEEQISSKEGAIGYANLGDARAKYNKQSGNHYHWLKVENESEEKPKFFYPGTSENEPTETKGEANCKETDYTNKPTKAGADDNWSEVNGAHIKGNVHYPICTLTYDVALKSYETAKYTNASKVGQTTFDYMTYVAAEKGGQEALKGNDYRQVEEAVGSFAREEAELVAGGPRKSPGWTSGGKFAGFGLHFHRTQTILTSLAWFRNGVLRELCDKTHVIITLQLIWGYVYLPTFEAGSCISKPTEKSLSNLVFKAPVAAQLLTRSGKFFVELRNVSFELPVVNSEGVVTGEEEVTGSLEGEYDNATQELIFPETALEGSTLVVGKEKEKVVIAGAAKLEGEGTVTAENE